MKDNKYQELMSHISMTPEMEKRVMEAVEAEIEEEEAIRDEGIILQKDDESIPGIPPVPKAREGDYRRQEKKEGAILFTGGGLALYPMPEYTCVSIDKAALRAFMKAADWELAKEM